MQIDRRGFLASLIAAPVLARIAGVETARPCPQNIAYLYSNVNITPMFPKYPRMLLMNTAQLRRYQEELGLWPERK